MTGNLKSLQQRLNKTTLEAVNGAIASCMSHTNYTVEVEHLLLKMLGIADSDFARILHQFGVDGSRCQAELQNAVDKFKRGSDRPDISPRIMRILTDAWTYGSLEYNSQRIRTGYILVALLSDEDLARRTREISRELGKIQLDALKKDFRSYVSASAEEAEEARAAASAGPSGSQPGQVKPGSKTPNLDQFTVNLTQRAKDGKIDPVLGRDEEIRKVVDILMRRRQNNPILTGEAGVGKTAVVEGFAIRVANKDVPPALQNVVVHTLDLALLQAGASVKGEFENRLKGLIEEVKNSPVPIILFIDEAHTMIGAGGQEGQGDAANLLKPALARGELRTLAATTWAEYKKYFEKDPALARRFQVVKVEEPTEEVCAVMLRGIVGSLEKHHGIRILDEGINAAVKFSHRYIAGRQLPDKAVSVLDTACARLALGQNATPGQIEDARRKLEDLEVQQRVLTRESNTGHDHSERLDLIAKDMEKTQAKLKELEERFEKEKEYITKIRELRNKLEDAKPEDDTTADKAEYQKLNAELDALQGETPMMRASVDQQIVGDVVSAWTGIPLGNMLRDEVETILKLEHILNQRVIGQDHALAAIAQRIRTSKARLEDPDKPIGVFMLVGPSGVGKTETAITLADQLYGGETNMITIAMSEFQEAHTVSTLKGSPPGYVGYGEGGVLTEAVRRKPYSVVLLDEVEKAHPDVLELFFQVFDKGRMEDGQGREIDFKNCIILLTSNAATDTLMKLVADPETMPSPEGIVKAMKPELDKVFKPAFLGRMVIIPYYPVRDENLKKIIRLKINKIKKRIALNHKINLTYTEALVDEVAKRCTEVESGARNVDNILTNTMLPDMSRKILESMASGEKITTVNVTVGEDSNFVYEQS
ncbi:ClpV1 family T6SS ATPase [Bryobacterales bacterium F-183]|nr:ClpV1 family T6SS ATPase [Bryobacterales bacterium F-183]